MNKTVTALISAAILGGGLVVLNSGVTTEQLNSKIDSVIVARELISPPKDTAIDNLKKYTDKIKPIDTTIEKIRDSTGKIIRRDTTIREAHWVIKGADENGVLNGLAYICPTNQKMLITISIDGEVMDILRIRPTLDSATVNVSVHCTQH